MVTRPPGGKEKGHGGLFFYSSFRLQIDFKEPTQKDFHQREEVGEQ